jgi:hypothetical protein
MRRPRTSRRTGRGRRRAFNWSDRPAKARRGRGRLAHLEGLDDVLWSGPLVALGLRAAAELAESARLQRTGAAADAVEARIEPLRTRLEWLAERVTTTSGRGWVAVAGGELARAHGVGQGAEWMAAVAAFDAVPDPIAAAYARFRAAEAALRTQGVRADVGELVRAAAGVAERVGARPLAAAVATLAARARIPAQRQADNVPPPSVEPESLTGRIPGRPRWRSACPRARSGARPWPQASRTVRSPSGCSSPARRRPST